MGPNGSSGLYGLTGFDKIEWISRFRRINWINRLIGDEGCLYRMSRRRAVDRRLSKDDLCRRAVTSSRRRFRGWTRPEERECCGGAVSRTGSRLRWKKFAIQDGEVCRVRG